jgi:hypothetical protein
MADFCNKCSAHLFGTQLTADIDVYRISEELQLDTYEVVLCEGCGLSAIGKDKAGQIYVAYPEGENFDPVAQEVRWYTLDEYEEINKQKSNI